VLRPTPAIELPSQSEVDPQAGFIKGDLARVGAIELRSDFDRVALHAGVQRIGREWLLTATPRLDLKFLEKYVRLGLAVPLRTLLLDEAAADLDRSGYRVKLRQEDWDEPGDYLKVLHQLTIGSKEEEFFLGLGQGQPVTLGHGTLVRRYSSNLDLDHTRTTVELDLYDRVLGMEAFIGDLASPSVVGALLFIKPDGLLSPSLTDRPLKRLSLGLSLASDVSAPLALSSVSRDGAEYLAVDETGNPLFREQAVTGLGVDAELKLVRTAHVDLKPYLDHSWLLNHGSGTTLGALARFSVGSSPPFQAWRLRGELRTFEADFLPGYFDALYEFQRYQYVTGQSPRQGFVPTKLAWLQEQVGGARRFGYYVEASWALVGWVALSAALEDSTAPFAKGLTLHAEIPANRFLTLFLTYHRRGEDSFAVPFDFEEDTEIFFWAVRLKILPILAINYRSQRAFAVNRFAQANLDRLYDNVFHFAVDLELGYEF
jgi:hypothetical protein